jgi:hypothetical protein
LTAADDDNEEMCHKVLQQVYEEGTKSITQVFVWIKQFQYGKKDDTDDKRYGHPTTSRTDPNVEKVTEMVKNDC